MAMLNIQRVIFILPLIVIHHAVSYGDINPHRPLELHFQAGSDVVIWNLNIVRG